MAWKRTTRSGQALSPSKQRELAATRLRSLERDREQRSWHLDPPAEYANNPHILSWWASSHDALLVKLITEFGHGWHQEITSTLIDHLPQAEVNAWRETDPLCARFAYYNILANFAVARARAMGFEDELPAEATVDCTVCDKPFLTTSLKAGVWREFGTEFCGVCLARAFWLDGDPLADEDAIVLFITNLHTIWGRIPPQTISTADLVGTPPDQRHALINALADRPTVERVHELFGSWFEALVRADVLDGGAQQMARGVRCLANDGHVCYSIGEKTIDDLLFASGIEHSREPRYPVGKMRADFLIGTTFVEYLGLAGTPSYDAKTDRKRAACADHNIPLIEIYPADLADTAGLSARLAAATLPSPRGCPR